MARIDEFLKHATANRSSDIHFSAGEPIRMRVDGDLVPMTDRDFSSEELQDILFEILGDQEIEKIGKSKNLDKSHIVEGVGYFRVNIFWTRRGIAAVLRTIPKKIPTVEELKLPPACVTLSEAPKGLVLVTGPTGSGKSTTLAAMINHINSSQHLHILTAEDPVEFVHDSKKSLINQREIGSSCHSFADALKYALREDPDVILVGEMRDLETIGLALTAAETGHLVFGTLHTRGAGASVDRIIDSFPANQQAMIRTMLSESLVGVISQALLKRCDKPGRAAAFEIMIVNHAISNLIREGKTFQIPSIIQTGRKEGMILMDQHILELVDSGIVAPEEAEAYLEDATPLQSRKKSKPASSLKVSSPTPATGTPAGPSVMKVSAAPPLQKSVTKKKEEIFDEVSLSLDEDRTGEQAITNEPIGEDPFQPSQEIDLSEALDLPISNEFNETKAIERDDTSTSEVSLETAAPIPTPKPSVPPLANSRSVSSPPPALSSPPPSMKASPPPPTLAPTPTPTPVVPPVAPTAPPVAKPSASPPPMGANPTSVPKAMPPRPGAVPGSKGVPPPPPPHVPHKKVG